MISTKQSTLVGDIKIDQMNLDNAIRMITDVDSKIWSVAYSQPDTYDSIHATLMDIYTAIHRARGTLARAAIDS